MTTANRIKKGYEGQGRSVKVLAYSEGLTGPDFQQVLENSSTKPVLHILHITRFVQWMQYEEVSIPSSYMVTMGGTDIHMQLSQRDLTQAEFAFVDKAQYVTLFTQEAKEILSQHNPAWESKLVVIPQGIELPTMPEKNGPLTGEVEESADDRPFHILLPAGLREVKDVLHLLPAWEHLYNKDRRLKVTIIGEVLEQPVLQDVKSACQAYPFLQFQDSVSFQQMGSLYAQADLVINTSKQEGQPTAVCEAMGLGIPVIVRDNPGNRSFVTHGQTGYVYQEPRDFVHLVDELINHPEKTERMVKKAQHFVQSILSVEKEIQAYLNLLTKLRR
ncbi:glycosyltransferase [Caldalkalibacillus salinus]|uniref:glycosyltransferase n=1 Tax=Caldalkalibacillus salinus TaxID=2803787 RepID=UPI0019228A43